MGLRGQLVISAGNWMLFNNNQLELRINFHQVPVDRVYATIYRPKQGDNPREVISKVSCSLGGLFSLPMPNEEDQMFQVFGYQEGNSQPLVGLRGNASDLADMLEFKLLLSSLQNTLISFNS